MEWWDRFSNWVANGVDNLVNKVVGEGPTMADAEAERQRQIEAAMVAANNAGSGGGDGQTSYVPNEVADNMYSWAKSNTDTRNNANQDATANAVAKGQGLWEAAIGGQGAEGPKLATPDDINLLATGIGQSNAANMERLGPEEAARQAAKQQKQAEETEKRKAFEQALQSPEQAKLMEKYGGADYASNVVGRQMFPESAKRMDDAGKFVFTSVAPGIAIPLYSAGDTLRAWKDNEARGRDAQIVAAIGALGADLAGAGLSTVAGSLKPALKYPGKVVSGVFADEINEDGKRQAEGRPPLSDSPDDYLFRLGSVEKKIIGVLANQILSGGRN